MKDNKRDSNRTHPVSECVAWRSASAPEPLRRGRVIDISQTGLAIHVAGVPKLSFGASLQTVFRRQAASRRARVVRIEQRRVGDAVETIVGCRWIAAPYRMHHVQGSPTGVSDPHCGMEDEEAQP